MKRLTILVTGMLGLALNSVCAGDAPRGSLLELHSCELYAGGCVVSSEAPQEGRYMVRAWDFTGGNHDGTQLKGLQLAVLQSSPDNLATPKSQSGEAVVYLPESATQSQRDALLAWLKSSQADFRPAKLQTRVVPLQFTKSDQGYAFSAGNFISVKTASLESCATGACGEALWYQPRSATSFFTVTVNRGSQVTEPLVKLNWVDAGRRSIFLARFGAADVAKNQFVTLPELCGATSTLF